jgi:copper chaperone
MTRTLTIDGMGCEGCADIVENALTDVDGVEDATADHEAGTATVEGDANPDALLEAVEFAGYEGELAFD